MTAVEQTELSHLRVEVHALRQELRRSRARAERLAAALREIAAAGGAAGELATRALVEASTG